MTKHNRKGAYVDFNKPEYQSLSDEEVQLVKKVKIMGYKISNCKEHGIYMPVNYKLYDNNLRTGSFFGCSKCFDKKYD